MDLVNIRICAEGHYSGATYEENRILSQKMYDWLKNSGRIDEIEIYIPDLNGKHSEVKADIEIQFFPEGEQDGLCDFICDGERLYENLKDFLRWDYELDIETETESIERYIKEVQEENKLKNLKASDTIKVNEAFDIYSDKDGNVNVHLKAEYLDAIASALLVERWKHGVSAHYCKDNTKDIIARGSMKAKIGYVQSR